MAVKTYRLGMSDIKLSANFTVREFECKCSAQHDTLIDNDLWMTLQNLRTSVGKPLSINSGHRCAAHNKAVGGAIQSPHLGGYAADVVPPPGMRPLELAGHAYLAGFRNIAIGKTYIHVDTRSLPSETGRDHRHWTYPGCEFTWNDIVRKAGEIQART